jgi:hypothetical protein
MRCKVHYEWLIGRWLINSDGGTGAATFVIWLWSDIQNSETMVDWFLDEIARAAKGELRAVETYDLIDLEPNDNPYFLGTGNSMSCWANSKFFYIECEYVGEWRVIMTIDQVREALGHYRLFTLGSWDDPQTTPEPFEYEYIAEEVEATKLAIEAGLISSDSEEVS